MLKKIFLLLCAATLITTTTYTFLEVRKRIAAIRAETPEKSTLEAPVTQEEPEKAIAEQLQQPEAQKIQIASNADHEIITTTTTDQAQPIIQHKTEPAKPESLKKRTCSLEACDLEQISILYPTNETHENFFAKNKMTAFENDNTSDFDDFFNTTRPWNNDSFFKKHRNTSLQFSTKTHYFFDPNAEHIQKNLELLSQELAEIAKSENIISSDKRLELQKTIFLLLAGIEAKQKLLSIEDSIKPLLTDAKNEKSLIQLFDHSYKKINASCDAAKKIITLIDEQKNGLSKTSAKSITSFIKEYCQIINAILTNDDKSFNEILKKSSFKKIFQKCSTHTILDPVEMIDIFYKTRPIKTKKYLNTFYEKINKSSLNLFYNFDSFEKIIQSSIDEINLYPQLNVMLSFSENIIYTNLATTFIDGALDSQLIYCEIIPENNRIKVSKNVTIKPLSEYSTKECSHRTWTKNYDAKIFNKTPTISKFLISKNPFTEVINDIKPAEEKSSFLVTALTWIGIFAGLIILGNITDKPHPRTDFPSYNYPYRSYDSYNSPFRSSYNF